MILHLLLCVWVCECVAGVVGGGVGVRLRVGCPCPPVRNDIVTPRHLFFPSFLLSTCISFLSSVSFRFSFLLFSFSFFLRTFFHVPIVTLPQTCYDLRLSSQQDFRLLCLTIASFLHDFLHIHNARQSTIFYVQSRQIVAKATDG